MKIENMRDMFKGKGPVYILGSGASLLQFETSWLKDEHTFACSRFFKWRRCPFIPTFYLISEEQQMAEFRERKLKKIKAQYRFSVNWQPAKRGWIEIPRPQDISRNVAHYGPGGNDKEFTYYHGRDCPAGSAQIAFWLGFRKIIFLGIETSPIGYVFDTEERRKVGDRYDAMKVVYKRLQELPAEFYDMTPNSRYVKDGILKPYERKVDVKFN